jgi:hypothetical protein
METLPNKPQKPGWKGPVGSNPGGRPKGSPNKVTMDIRTAYQNLVELNLENMSHWLGQIAIENPEKAFELMIKLSEYVIPKMQRTEVVGKDGADLFKDMRFEFGPSINEREDSEEPFDIDNP